MSDQFWPREQQFGSLLRLTDGRWHDDACLDALCQARVDHAYIGGADWIRLGVGNLILVDIVEIRVNPTVYRFSRAVVGDIDRPRSL
jgi:hypothetical protein